MVEARIIGARSLRRELVEIRKRFPGVESSIKFDLANVAQSSMKRRIRESQAIATGALFRSVQVFPRGDNLVVGVIGTQGEKLKALAVNDGLREKPHVVRVDTRRAKFKAWAQRTGKGDNLTKGKGPWFSYGWHGKPFAVNLDFDKLPVYLKVGGKPSSILFSGINFLEAGEQAVNEGIDILLDKKIDTLFRK